MFVEILICFVIFFLGWFVGMLMLPLLLRAGMKMLNERMKIKPPVPPTERFKGDEKL